MLPRTIFQEEHNIFREQVRKWLEKEVVPYHEQWEKDGKVPEDLWRKAGEQGFLCPWVEEEYGGPGADWLYSVVVLEEITNVGASGVAFTLHSDVVVPYLHSFGTEEQKKKWLPGCIDGSIITAVAMTEPGTGSDLAAVTTTAVDEGDHWRINGSKTFITNGLISNLVVVVAKTEMESDNPHNAFSLIVVDADAPGFERGRKLEKIGMKAQDTAELFFNDCIVPKENILGERGMGFMYLMQKLQQERLVVAIGAAAGMESAVQHTLEYTKNRKAFGRSIAKFQNTRFKLVESHTTATIARVFVDRLIEAHMSGAQIVSETSMAKYWTTDELCNVVDECLQLHGGYGYMREYPIARAYEDARVQRIYAGTNEIMKEIIGKFDLGL